VRFPIVRAACFAIAVSTAALAQEATKIADPKVNSHPVDQCADINANLDCTAQGAAKAALNACIANGYTQQAGWHTRPASGQAMHFITEYDMHAGEVGGHWEEKPSNGTFDWILCRK
jgi:hypothetical protein